MKTDVNVLSKSNKQKKIRKNLFFVGILSATDEKKSRFRIQSRIPIWIRKSVVRGPRIRIRTKMSRIHNTAI